MPRGRKPKVKEQEKPNSGPVGRPIHLKSVLIEKANAIAEQFNLTPLTEYPPIKELLDKKADLVATKAQIEAEQRELYKKIHQAVLNVDEVEKRFYTGEATQAQLDAAKAEEKRCRKAADSEELREVERSIRNLKPAFAKYEQEWHDMVYQTIEPIFAEKVLELKVALEQAAEVNMALSALYQVLDRTNQTLHDKNEYNKNVVAAKHRFPEVYWPSLLPDHINNESKDPNKPGGYVHTQLGNWLRTINGWFDGNPVDLYRFSPLEQK